MNLTPDSRQAITDRVVAKSRSLAMVRLRELEVEGRRLRAEAKDLTMRLGLYCGKISTALLELRSGEETTVRLLVLPDEDAKR